MAIWAKSRHDRVVTGTLGGLAERWGWNPTVLRVLYVVLTFLTLVVPGFLLYVILAAVMD